MSKPSLPLPPDLHRRLLADDGMMRQINQGTWGICLACFSLAHITRHHVVPKASIKPLNWRPLQIMICRDCHQATHKFLDHSILVTHVTIADAITAIREAREKLRVWKSQKKKDS